MYGKFFSSTFTGSMFGAGPEAFAVWGYVIANTTDSRVELNPTLLAAIIGTTPEKVAIAIEYLTSPDSNSRNTDHEGRRLVKDGQFQYRVVSHEIYRAIMNEKERRDYNALKQRQSRDRKKILMSNPMSLTVNDKSALSAHTETEAEAEAKEEKITSPSAPCSPEEGGKDRPRFDFTEADIWFEKTWDSYENLIPPKGQGHIPSSAKQKTKEKFRKIVKENHVTPKGLAYCVQGYIEKRIAKSEWYQALATVIGTRDPSWEEYLPQARKWIEEEKAKEGHHE